MMWSHSRLGSGAFRPFACGTFGGRSAVYRGSDTLERPVVGSYEAELSFVGRGDVTGKVVSNPR